MSNSRKQVPSGQPIDATEDSQGNSGATKTIDYSIANLFKVINIDQNTTITVTTPARPQYLHLRVTNNGTFTVAFSNTVQWKDNSPYVASGTDSDLVIFYWSGSVLLGSWGSYGT